MSTSLRQQAYEHIQQRILDGMLQPGSVVSEASLARQLGISRTPVGAAIRQLVSEGLVEQVPRYGTIVRLPSRRDIVELYELREAIEGFAAAKAAELISAEVLMQLDQYCRVFQELIAELRRLGAPELTAVQMRRFFAADLAFHLSIVQASGNARMLRIVKTSKIIAQIFRMPVAPHNVPLVEGVYRFHTRVCEALRAHDGNAARETLVDHIRSSREERLDIHERIVADAQHGGGTAILPANMQAELDDLCQRFSADDAGAAWKDGRQPG